MTKNISTAILLISTVISFLFSSVSEVLQRVHMEKNSNPKINLEDTFQ